MNKSDQELIDECLAGETEAFGRLVIRYQDRLYNTIVRVMGTSDEARDIAQDAFVQAFQKLSTFRGQSAFYSWLFRIAVNTAVSHQRKTRRSPSSIDAAREQSGAEPIDPHQAAAPSHALELIEQQTQIREALNELNAEYRTVLVLKDIEGLKYEQIAEILEVPIGTVRSRIHRARGDLREKLARLFDEDSP